MHVSFNIFPNSGHIGLWKVGSENVIIPKLAHQNIILPKIKLGEICKYVVMKQKKKMELKDKKKYLFHAL